MGESPLGARGSLLALVQDSEKGRALEGRGSLGRNPGRVLHLTRVAPLQFSLSQGEGPPVRRSLDHSWKPGAFPGPGGRGTGVVLLQTQAGLPKAACSPGSSPQSPGQSLRKMENHRAGIPLAPFGLSQRFSTSVLQYLTISQGHWPLSLRLSNFKK